MGDAAPLLTEVHHELLGVQAASDNAMVECGHRLEAT